MPYKVDRAFRINKGNEGIGKQLLASLFKHSKERTTVNIRTAHAGIGIHTYAQRFDARVCRLAYKDG